MLQDRADCMYIVMDGAVNLYAKTPHDDDAYVPIDWATVKQELSAVQSSLDAIKVLANVPLPAEIQGIKKPEAPSHDPPASGPPRSGSASARSGEHRPVAVYDEETNSFNARKTWGKLFGGVKLAAIVANAADELEKAGKKMHHRGAEAAFIGMASKGESFGEGGLLSRRPGTGE